MTSRRKSEELAEFLAGSDDPEEIALAWQAYAKGSPEELAQGTRAAQEALREGDLAEMIAIAGMDISARARAAARHPQAEDL